MFTPLKPGIVETVARGGKIEFKPFSGWERQSIERLYFLGIPHAIMYRVEKNGFGVLRWFDCRLSVLNNTIIVDDIIVSSASLLTTKNKDVEKPLIHMALGLVVDEAISFALKHEKTKVVVSSSLPGTADVLFEKNFIIRTKDLFNNISTTRGFRGLKVL